MIERLQDVRLQEKNRINKGGEMLVNEVKKVKVGKDIEIGGNNRFTLIAGPCVIESEELVRQIWWYFFYCE